MFGAEPHRDTSYTMDTDRAVYEPWEWEPLQLVVLRQTPSAATAHFVDTRGRTSARALVQTDQR